MDNLELAVNHAMTVNASNQRSVASYLGQAAIGNTKRTRLYEEFGYPDTIKFNEYLKLYERNSIAGAAIDLISNGCFEDYPEVFEGTKKDDATGNSNWDNKVAKLLKKWFPVIKEADKRGLIGNYSAILIQLKDNKSWSDKVDKGITKQSAEKAIVRLIPVWENQLSVSTWDNDEKSENYGYPTMYSYTNVNVGDNNGGEPTKVVSVHPDRVIILCESSVDGLITNGVSKLKKGYNDALDIEKISGGAAEGFLKNASRQLNFNFSKDSQLDQIARMYGVEVDKLANAIDDQVKRFNSNTDSSVIMQDGSASVLSVAAADPQPSFNVSLSKFASSIPVPVKILIGQITGDRASTEDNKMWARTRMSRRNGFLTYLIETIIRRLVSFNILEQPKEDEITVSWSDLLAPSYGEKLENANKLADIAQKTSAAFTYSIINPNEIRAAAELETLAEFDNDKVDNPKGNPLDDNGQDKKSDNIEK